MPCDPLECVRRTLQGPPAFLEFRSWNEKLRGSEIAEALHLSITGKDPVESRQSLPFGAQPDVREFVCQGEQLGRFCVCAVDEDQRCMGVGQRESSELLHVELAVRVVAD